MKALLILAMMMVSASVFADDADRACYETLVTFNQNHGEYLPSYNDGVSSKIYTVGSTICADRIEGSTDYRAFLNGVSPQATGLKYAGYLIDPGGPVPAKAICDVLRKFQGQNGFVYIATALDCTLTIATGEATCHAVMGELPTGKTTNFGNF